MASFCAKCGAALQPGIEVCSACGTPVAQSAYTPAQPFTPAAASAPPPPYGQPSRYPAATPPAKSGGALKIVLIMVAVVAGLGLLALGVFGFAAWRFSRAIHTNGSSITMGKSANVSEEDLGVAVYPGSVRKESGGMKIKTANNLVVSAMYTTQDPISSVVDFYHDKLGGASTETQAGRATTLTSATVVDKVKDSTVVTVTRGTKADDGSTQIMILHTKVTKP